LLPSGAAGFSLQPGALVVSTLSNSIFRALFPHQWRFNG
jgi:hypothetical protein